MTTDTPLTRYSATNGALASCFITLSYTTRWDTTANGGSKIMDRQKRQRVDNHNPLRSIVFLGRGNYHRRESLRPERFNQ
jgi:hypothetical protein